MTEQLEVIPDRMTWAGQSSAVFRVPDLAPGEAASWARGEAEALAALGFVRNDPFSLTLIANLLHALAVEPRPESSAWRFILVPAMGSAPIAVDLGFSRACGDHSEAMDRVLRTGHESMLGAAVTDVTVNGVPTRQSLCFSFREPETGVEAHKGEPWVTAKVACRRDLGARGATDIVATASTPQVDALEPILAALRGLVSGDPLGAAISGRAR